MTHATGARDFAAVVEARAAERPNAVALGFADTDTTWSALVGRVQRLAAALRAAGIAPGDRIAVLDLNHPSAVELTLACAQIGAANAVVNFRLAPPELVYVITDAQARILFVGPEFAPVVDELRADLTTVQRVVRVADEYEPFLAAHEPDPGHHPAAPDDCFLQLYTSGTTGFPKGAMLTHRGLLALAESGAADADITGADVLQVAMPLFHVGGMRSPCSTTSPTASRTPSSCPPCWRRWCGCRANGPSPRCTRSGTARRRCRCRCCGPASRCSPDGWCRSTA